MADTITDITLVPHFLSVMDEVIPNRRFKPVTDSGFDYPIHIGNTVFMVSIRTINTRFMGRLCEAFSVKFNYTNNYYDLNFAIYNSSWVKDWKCVAYDEAVSAFLRRHAFCSEFAPSQHLITDDQVVELFRTRVGINLRESLNETLS